MPKLYGVEQGCGVGRGLGVTLGAGVGVGVGVAVGLGSGVGHGVPSRARRHQLRCYSPHPHCSIAPLHQRPYFDPRGVDQQCPSAHTCVRAGVGVRYERVETKCRIVKAGGDTKKSIVAIGRGAILAA